MYFLEKKEKNIIYRDMAEKIEMEVPADYSMGLIQMKDRKGIKDTSVFRDALSHPVSGKALYETAVEKQAKSACILVSDASRSVPSALAAPYLIEELHRAGIAYSHILFVVATGVHRDATAEEMRRFVGEEYYGKVHIENHRPYDALNLIYLGETSFGTPVEVNKRAYECDLHICIGKVEPHEFAGFSGGRKSVLPGICSAKTIQINHAPQRLLDSHALPGILEGNEIHKDMVEAAELFGIDFSVNFVLNSQMETAALFAGGLLESHKAAVDYLKDYCGVTLTEKPDVIITTPGIPLNLDFYQSMKPLIALTDILDRDITVGLYCQCPEGIQSVDMLRPFEKTHSLEDMVLYLNKNYRIQMDHALLLCKILKKDVKIFVYSPNVDDSVIRTMYMTPSENPQGLLEDCIRASSKASPKVLFYPCPQKGLPVLKE